MLNTYFESAIMPAISAGLGALHIKDRMSSLNEIEMDDILPTMAHAAKKLRRTVSDKFEDTIDDAGHMVRKMGRAVANKASDMKEDLESGYRTLKTNIKDRMEDRKEGPPNLDKKVGRLWRDNITTGDGEYARGIKRYLKNKAREAIQNADDNKVAMAKRLRAAITKQANELAEDDLGRKTGKMASRFLKKDKED